MGNRPLLLAIADVGDLPPADTADVVDYLLGIAPIDPMLDTNQDGQIDAADVVETMP